jgi:ABC-type antimicrobial peptide transport system permease subunit
MNASGVLRLLRRLLLVALTLLLCAFHGFVGWHKAFSSHAELVQHTAWTMHLPIWLGKLVGWLEMGLTAALLAALLRPSLARLGVWSCVAFVVLELVSAATHQLMRDGASLAQNALTVVLTALLAWLYAQRRTA